VLVLVQLGHLMSWKWHWRQYPHCES
jgi:hypothetical protein